MNNPSICKTYKASGFFNGHFACVVSGDYETTLKLFNEVDFDTLSECGKAYPYEDKILITKNRGEK